MSQSITLSQHQPKHMSLFCMLLEIVPEYEKRKIFQICKCPLDPPHLFDRPIKEKLVKHNCPTRSANGSISIACQLDPAIRQRLRCIVMQCISPDQRWKNVQILQIYLCYLFWAVLIYWLYTRKQTKTLCSYHCAKSNMLKVLCY